MRCRVVIRGLRKALCLLCSAALVLATSAVDAAVASSHDTWTAPTTMVSEDQIASSDVVTVGSHGAATAAPELLGLNGTVLPMTINPKTLSEAQNSNRLGVYGTDVNKVANPYLHNEFYNYYAQENNLEMSTAVPIKSPSNESEDYFDKTYYGDTGTPTDLVSRPDIVIGVDRAVGTVSGIKFNRDTTDALNYATWGSGEGFPSQSYQNVVDIRRRTGSSELVGKTNSDGNAYVESEYYRDGDESYDPIAVRYSGRGSAELVDTVNSLAKAARLAMQQRGKTTRYGDPLQIACKYEQYVKGIKWHVLSRIAARDSGVTAKRKVAVLAKVAKDSTSERPFTLYKLAPDGSNTALAEIPAAEAAQDTTVDVAGECYPNAAAGAEVAVTADQLMGADVIVCMPYIADSYDSTKATLTATLAAKGFTDASQWPRIFDRTIPLGTCETGLFAKSVESAMLVGLIQGFIYPELIDPVDMMTYYASEFFHMKDSELESFVNLELHDVTLPSGWSLTGHEYAQSKVDAVQSMLDTAALYYFKNKSEIDESRARIASSGEFDYMNGYNTKNYTIDAPSGARLHVYDAYGLEVSPDQNGAFVLPDTADTGSFTLELAGYQKYTGALHNSSPSVRIEETDLSALRLVRFSVPDGASLVVLDASGRPVAAVGEGNTSYYLETGVVIGYTVQLDGYEDYRGLLSASATSAVVTLDQMTPAALATTIVIPDDAILSVVDEQGAPVTGSDGVYEFNRGEKYTLTVRLDGFYPYVATVVGGERSKITIYRANLTKLPVGKSALTLNKSTISASLISSIDAATVKTITLGAKVKRIAAKAFAKCPKLKTLVVKSKKLSKKTVKNSLKSSKVSTVQVKVGSKSANKKYKKAYAKIFVKKVAGKTAKVK